MNGKSLFSRDLLKLIAAFSMLVDHMGLLLFDDCYIMRAVGRISFPIFAFFIYEGCKHTKHRLKYFLRVFLLGIICYTAYFIFTGDTTLNVLLNFSIAILIIYLIKQLKSEILNKNRKTYRLIIYSSAVILSVAASWILCSFIHVEYGFFGIMIPVFAECADIEWLTEKSKSSQTMTQKSILRYLPLAGCFSAAILLCFDRPPIQWFSLLAFIPLIFADKTEQKSRLGYFFYIFYPAHLLILTALSYLPVFN